VAHDKEIELKLEIDPAALQQLRDERAKAIGAAAETRQSLSSVYFDTKKRRLHKAGYSLRVRADGNRRIQTIKQEPQGAAGLFERPEWSVEIDGDEPDLAQVKATPLECVVSAKQLRGRLKPVFWTEVERTTWNVRSRGAEVEVALDEGRVVANGQRHSFAELELELKSGSPSELFKLARALNPAGALKLGVLSKSERGYALAAKHAPEFFRAEPINLQPLMSTADGFKTIVQACIRHFRLNEPLLIQTRTAEPLHQCRVAVRRLRTALSVFKDFVADDELERLKDRLRSISRQLGEARDLDVLLAKLAEAPQDDHTGAEPEQRELIEHAQADREHAYDRVIGELQGRRFQTLLFDLLAWSEAGQWLKAGDAAAQARRQGPIGTFAVQELERRRRKVRKRGLHLDELDPPHRHRVRIEAKKLRYASEFFSSLATNTKRQQRHEAFAKALEDLQEHLGELNDLARRDKIATDRAAHEGQAVGASSSSRHGTKKPGRAAQRHVQKRVLAAATRAFRAFADAKPFWPAKSHCSPKRIRKRAKAAALLPSET
jgi:triphosphatase